MSYCENVTDNIECHKYSLVALLAVCYQVNQSHSAPSEPLQNN